MVKQSRIELKIESLGCRASDVEPNKVEPEMRIQSFRAGEAEI